MQIYGSGATHQDHQRVEPDANSRQQDHQGDEPNATHNEEMRNMPPHYHDSASRSDICNSDTQNEDSASEWRILTEKDVENFLANETCAHKLQETMNENDSDFKPELGMQFYTREEAQKFFNLYAFQVGFSDRKSVV